MKPFIKVQLKRVYVPSDMGEEYIIQGLYPADVKRTTLTVLDDGSTFVTWLEPVRDWKQFLHWNVDSFINASIVFLLMIFFWEFGYYVLKAHGVL